MFLLQLNYSDVEDMSYIYVRKFWVRFRIFFYTTDITQSTVSKRRPERVTLISANLSMPLKAVIETVYPYLT